MSKKNKILPPLSQLLYNLASFLQLVKVELWAALKEQL